MGLQREAWWYAETKLKRDFRKLGSRYYDVALIEKPTYEGIMRLPFNIIYFMAWAYELKPIWGGTKFLPEKFVTAITSPKKKKKRSSPVSLHLFHHFRPKYVTKREAKQVMTFFFFRDVIVVTNFLGKI